MRSNIREPHALRQTELGSDSTILVCLLGPFRLLKHDHPLDVLIAGKGATLLTALALHLESGVPRETLLDMIWPEQDWTQSTVLLNGLVYGLHRRLRDEMPEATPVIFANGSYFLNTTAGYSTDIARFDAYVASGDRLAAASRETEARIQYERAVALYRGDLCTGTDVFAIVERERLRSSFLTMLFWLANHAFHSEDYATALSHGHRVLGCDPCREDAHRLVMRVHVRRGERSQALRQYRLCEHVLRSEFDSVPEPLTTELFECIRVAPSGI